MSEWYSGAVTANGIKIHYERTGGEKPPVVLLHGVTDNGLCWTRLARALEPDYDLIMVDARGHGLSDAPAAGYGPADHAADVAGLIQALALGKPVLLGHSMGAATAAATAASYPERVGAIILEDPPFWQHAPGPAEALAAQAAEWRAGIIANKSKTVAELIALCRAQSPSWDEAELLAWAESKRQVSPKVATVVGAFRTSWQDGARHIACPVLLITADPKRGAIVTPEVAQEAAALWPRGRVVHIPGAGHNIRREQFEPYLEAVRGFLAKATRP